MAATKRGLVNIRRAMTSTPDYLDSITVNNYWDPARIMPSAHTLSDSNKAIAFYRATPGWATGFAKSILPLDRKSVVEFRLDAMVNRSIVGFSIQDPTLITSFYPGYPGQGNNQAGICWTLGSGGALYKAGGTNGPISALPAVEGEFMPGDVMGFGYDPINGTVKLWKNGIPLYGGVPVFHTLVDKKITLSAAPYAAGDKVTLLSGASLKYKYSDYGLNSEGRITPGQAVRKFDSARKPTVALIDTAKFHVQAPSAISGGSTGYVNTPMASDRKTVIEFIASATAYAAMVGFIFNDADKTGPKAGLLGTLANSVGMYIGGASKGNFSTAGATQNFATSGATIVDGDVIAFGYDPAAKTIVAWRNGVALQSGNPIWSGLPTAEVSAAYTLVASQSRVKLNSDALRYTYAGYSE